MQLRKVVSVATITRTQVAFMALFSVGVNTGKANRHIPWDIGRWVSLSSRRLSSTRRLEITAGRQRAPHVTRLYCSFEPSTALPGSVEETLCGRRRRHMLAGSRSAWYDRASWGRVPRPRSVNWEPLFADAALLTTHRGSGLSMMARCHHTEAV